VSPSSATAALRLGVAGAALLASSTLVGACAKTTPGRGPANVASPSALEAPPSFAEWEQARLAELATVDPRLSLRMRLQPTEADSQKAVLGAILAEDQGLRVLGQRADLFSFDGRARELDRIAARVASPPRSVPGSDVSLTEGKEVELLARMVAEERARVDEERRLPSSASALVRGILVTWSAPASMAELRERDEWLAARLDEVSASMAGASLRAVEVTELEDALDPLERLANPSGFPHAQGALARLRVALGAAHAGSGSGMGWPRLHDRLVVHLGVAEPEPALRAELAHTEARLREEAKAELAALPDGDARDALRAAGSLVVDGTSVTSRSSARAAICEGEGSASRVRLFQPPPERAVVSASLCAVAVARTDATAAALLVALHDAVAIATWAVVIHVDHVDPDDAPRGHFLLGDVAPEEMGKLIRFAATRPAACIASARMAALLGEGGAIERQGRARRWLAFGDAPLDIVAREMAWSP
jgi:hypothetical protein